VFTKNLTRDPPALKRLKLKNRKTVHPWPRGAHNQHRALTRTIASDKKRGVTPFHIKVIFRDRDSIEMTFRHTERRR